MTAFDLEQFLTVDVPARLRAALAVEDLPTIGTADNIHEAMSANCLYGLPAALVIYDRGSAKKQPGGGTRIYVGRRNQKWVLRFSILWLTESYAQDAKLESVRAGWRLMPSGEEAIHGWPLPPYPAKRCECLSNVFVMRSPDLARVGHESTFETEVERFTAPAQP